MRAERFELMARLAQLPRDMVFFTQITMEAAEDPEFLDAMKRARINGALVGVESVTPEGLKDVYKDFNLARRRARRAAAGVPAARRPRARLVHLRPAERPARDLRRHRPRWPQRAGVTFAQFVMLTPFPGTVDFEKWEKSFGEAPPEVDGIPLTRHWLIPQERAAQGLSAAPGDVARTRSAQRTQAVWDEFYSLPQHLAARRTSSSRSKARLAFVLISKLYRQMYANTGHRHRQRPRAARQSLGAPDRRAVPAALRRQADAGTAGSGGRRAEHRVPELSAPQKC